MLRKMSGKYIRPLSINKDRRITERREEEDTGAWKIFGETWNKYANRRYHQSRRMADSSDWESQQRESRIVA